MKILVKPFTVHKRFPLTISRGTSSENTNLWVILQEEDIEGWGEATPFSVTQEGYKNTEILLNQFTQIIPDLERFHPLDRQKIRAFLQQKKVSSALQAAIDMALYDWLGKKANLPLWKLWGLDPTRIVPVSVTVGINPPEKAKERLRNWQEVLDVQIVKIKLGSPEGIEADRAIITAIKEENPALKITVDANGGWTIEDAIMMSHWLADRGVEYIEQPLPVGQENQLKSLKQRSPLPIFIDESCFNTLDILRLADSIDGINIKIMKAGGLTEALKMINLAQVCGLKIMFGCYSDSSLANTAMAHLAPLADYLDLDSHLNLIDDPFIGVKLEKGRLVLPDLPGLGCQYNS